MEQFKDLIDAIIGREVDPRDFHGITNDPKDRGGPTRYGIAKNANPDLWKNGPPTHEQAQERYYQRYIHPFRLVTDRHLLHQLVDWGVTSGPVTVAKILQQIVGVKADGVIGPQTLAAIERFPAGRFFSAPVAGITLLNLRIRDARASFYAGITKRDPSQTRFILGWLNRTFEFK